MIDIRVSRCVTLLCAGLTWLMLSGCQGGVETTRVTGIVTVDGKPVELGIISFEPEVASEHSATAEIHNGVFAIDSPRGTRRVSIMAYRQAKGLGPDGKPYQEQYLPAKFNLESDRLFEVDYTPMVDQKFELKLTDK